MYARIILACACAALAGCGSRTDLGSVIVDMADQAGFLISQPSGLSAAVRPMVMAKSSVEFYAYESKSSHTGLEMRGESRVYLYVDSTTGRLSLVVTHGKDDDQPISTVEMDITGIPKGFAIDVADDYASEFFTVGPSSAQGRWIFEENSDGGVIGGLPFPGNWQITVTPRFVSGIVSWTWVREDTTRIPLVMTEPVTIKSMM